jgi:hypothetical protein
MGRFVLPKVDPNLYIQLLLVKVLLDGEVFDSDTQGSSFCPLFFALCRSCPFVVYRLLVGSRPSPSPKGMWMSVHSGLKSRIKRQILKNEQAGTTSEGGS